MASIQDQVTLRTGVADWLNRSDLTDAQIDQFRPSDGSNLQGHATELDRWIISELNALVEQVDISLDSVSYTHLRAHET